MSEGMARARRHVAVAVFLLGGLLLASCERTPSKSDYVSAQVTVLCEAQSGDERHKDAMQLLQELWSESAGLCQVTELRTGDVLVHADSSVLLTPYCPSNTTCIDGGGRAPFAVDPPLLLLVRERYPPAPEGARSSAPEPMARPIYRVDAT